MKDSKAVSKLILIGVPVLVVIVSLIIVLVVFRIFPPSERVHTWTVDDDEPADFHTIQEAVDAAKPEDTILVKAGTYKESYVEVTKALTISGENKSTTIIDGKGMVGAVIAIKANSVNLSGFTIRNGAWGTAGIYMGEASECIVRNNLITSNIGGYGIDLYSSSDNYVSDNIIASNERGIYLSYSSNNNTINNNTVLNNVDGIYLSYGCTGNTFSGNTVMNNSLHGVYYYSFYGDEPCDSNALIGNTIANNYRGVRLEYSARTRIYHNNFINNTDHVLLQEALDNTWDNGYPSGGNYWGNHVCTGNPSDGSKPYIIDADNVDHYPFQDPDGWLP